MIKRILGISGAAVLVGLLCLFWAWHLWTGPGPMADAPEGGTALVRIPAGMTLIAAADTLVSHGLLKDPRVLLAGAKLTRQGRGLRAGLYELSYGASPRELLGVLTAGIALQVRVTIPEGLDAEDIAALMSAALGFSAEEFLASADSLVFEAAAAGLLLGDGEAASLDALLKSESALHPRHFRWCEGHLAPDTFLFAEGTGAEKAAEFMVATQWARLDSVMAVQQVVDDSGLSRQDLLVLASIVEAEARHDQERSLIAAVYTNRLHKNRRLEADPTVAYILRKKGKRLLYKDLEVSSPFNTYRNKGLPPGPISSPGLASLQAAANPDTSCRAMFFVSDGKGGHVFSRTASEHEAAVREYRRTRGR